MKIKFRSVEFEMVNPSGNIQQSIIYIHVCGQGERSALQLQVWKSSVGSKGCMIIDMVMQNKYMSERNASNSNQMNRNFNKKQVRRRQ